jgi:hypothetical protein
VTEAGQGMTADVVARAFEPFHPRNREGAAPASAWQRCSGSCGGARTTSRLHLRYGTAVTVSLPGAQALIAPVAASTGATAQSLPGDNERSLTAFT